MVFGQEVPEIAGRWCWNQGIFSHVVCKKLHYHDYISFAGDTLTCVIEHFSPEKALVNFIKNGRLVFRQWVNLPDDQLYPTIGFENGPIEISVDWPLSDMPPPKFNKVNM
jgi:hypothetical protein